MFDFTTTTIINSAEGFKKADNTAIVLNHGINLKASQITEIKRTPYRAALNDSAAITVIDPDPALTEDTVYRLAIYLKLRGSNNFLYANDLIYKGKPLYIEAMVPAGSDATAIATALTASAKNVILQLTKLDGKDIVTVSNVAGAITITAGTEFLVIDKANLEQYIPGNCDSCDSGEFKTLVKGEVTTGNLSFGSFAHLQRDIQLPSDANLRYKRLYEDEVPVPGAKYNQYIITMEADRKSFTGQGAVGQTLKSKTTHVVWVEESFDATIKEDIAKAGPNGKIKDYDWSTKQFKDYPGE